MKIYDSVIINTKNANKNILNKLKKELRKRFIKIYTELKNFDYYEHETLLIEIIKDKILIDNNEILLNDIFVKYKFVANIFSFEKDINKYLIDYAKYVDDKKRQSVKLLSKYKIKNNFDFVSGAVYISDEEYYLLNNTKLKKILFTNKNNCYKYVIPTENGFMLRGCSTYYYLLSNKGKFEKVNINHFEEFIRNHNNYFKEILDVLVEEEYFDSILILSILDNIRNFLLILINALIISNQINDETLIYELTNCNYINILDNVYDIYDQMISIINKNKFDKYKIINILNDIFKYKFLDIVKKTDNNFFDKMLKSHRECDCFIENYLTVLNFIKHNKNTSNFIGTLYGGIEIPLIAYYLKNKRARVIYISLFGIYNQRHKCKLNYDYILKKINNKINDNKIFNCVLCDDNMLTGKTLQYIIDSLIMENITVNKILLINHVNMNRIFQILDNKTLLDLSIVDKYIFGLNFGTKYSKIKFDENRKNSYLDEFDLFDLTKECLCYYIYKNKIYSKKSRIYNYKIGGNNE